MVETSPTLLQDFALITVAAAVALILFRRLKQPAILGYLLVGVLIGPYTLPHSPVGNIESIRLLADLGLVVLLFALGLELGWDRIRRVGLRVVLIGVIEISLMVIIGYQVGKLLGWSANEALFLGAAVSISSSAVIVKMLNDTGPEDHQGPAGRGNPGGRGLRRRGFAERPHRHRHHRCVEPG